MRKTTVCCVCLCLAGIILSQPALAQQAQQTDWGDVSGAVTLAHNIQKALMGILQVFLIFGAIGGLAFSVYHIMSGRSDEAKKFVWVFVAFSVGFVLVRVVGNYMASSTGTGLVASISAVLKSLLITVSLIAMTGIVYKMMHGDEQSYQRLYLWLLGLVVGITLLDVFASHAGEF